VLRFTNEDVFDHPEEVLQQISEFVLTHSYEKALPSRPSPTLRERGGSEETEQAREKLNDSPLPQRGRGAGGEGNISPLPQRGRGVGGEGFTVLYIGTLAPWQGVDFLLDALKLVVAQKPLRLQILGVGRREWRKALEKRVRKLGLMEYVEFLSPVPHEQVPAVIHAATICVAPLAPTERNVVQGCCPVKIFEYMACGKPIVAANLPVVREILTHEEDALLYKVHKPSRLAACLLRLAEDGELQQRLGENAWRKAQEQFSWQRAQTALRQVYATMLS
jgi:glycosyltransferase involved in cell wall biosynthesis